MSSCLFFFLRWLFMRCLLMRNLLTFSTKKSHMSRYLKSSLLTSLYRFIHQDARRLLMSDLFVEKVSRFLMSRHLMSSHLKKKMRWLLMRCLLTTTWTGLISGTLNYHSLSATVLNFVGRAMLVSLQCYIREWLRSHCRTQNE